MSGPRELPPVPTRSARLGWTLGGWLLLSVAAAVVGLVVHRPPDRPAERPAGRVEPPASSRPLPSPSASRPASSMARARTADGSSDWQLQLFFTAASSYYGGSTVRVTGCADVACRPAVADLGRYARGFVRAVRTQGSGYIGSGPHRGRYLDWDAQRGYWLDTVPRGPGAVPLQAFVSVISSTLQLSPGTTLRVASCGAGSRAGWAAVCARLRATPWSVAAVAPGSATGRTVRLYVGTENRHHFRAGPWADTFRSAVLRVG
jgi:hypothetical protein